MKIKCEKLTFSVGKEGQRGQVRKVRWKSLNSEVQRFYAMKDRKKSQPCILCKFLVNENIAINNIDFLHF